MMHYRSLLLWSDNSFNFVTHTQYDRSLHPTILVVSARWTFSTFWISVISVWYRSNTNTDSIPSSNILALNGSCSYYRVLSSLSKICPWNALKELTAIFIAPWTIFSSWGPQDFLSFDNMTLRSRKVSLRVMQYLLEFYTQGSEKATLNSSKCSSIPQI